VLTSSRKDQLAGFGESAFIREFLGALGQACPPSPLGPGDDTAVLPASDQPRLVTADPVVFEQHFASEARPADVAAKLIRRNLSDIAAMGGRPEAAVLSMSLNPKTSRAWLRLFGRALGREARRFGIAIVGGDCNQTHGPPGFFMTLIGRAHRRRILTRTGALEGDAIYVTGALGGSILGHQFRFMPRLEEGRWLAGRQAVHAMIDVSDGLGKDLLELIPDGLAASLQTGSIPITPAARKLARTSGRSPLAHAIQDGEDFELLFTVSKRTDPDRFAAAWKKEFRTRLSRIGRLIKRPSDAPPIRLEKAPSGFVLGPGYEHFR
jgi:thiamine-monophosphate kinase